MKKHTLVVGGTRGSGLVLVKDLIKEGHLVSVVGQEVLPVDLNASGLISGYIVDISDKKKIQKVLAKSIKKNGRLSGLVFFQRYRGNGDDWEGEFAVSLSATKNIIEFLADDFLKNEGAIVVVSSIAGRLIADEQPLSYHVAKAGLEQMVRFFAAKLGRKGIRVNSVCPGSILKEGSEEIFKKNKELFQLIEKIIPLGRMGTSQDVAEAVKFLCSKRASFITGQEILLDGGLSLLWQEALSRKIGLKNKN